MEPKWDELLGGYRRLYDPRQTIERLGKAPLDRELWRELWNELHHQGRVGDASYAAVPLLVTALSEAPRDWNFYGLLALIEVERFRKENPPLPDWLSSSYATAIQSARRLALTDLAGDPDVLTVRAATGLVALVCGAREVGAFLTLSDSSEIRDELVEQYGWDTQFRHPLSRADP